MNKGDIVKKLRERGLSRRDAVRILDTILDEVSAALGRGEAVEFAFGSLKRVRHAHKQQQGRFLNRAMAHRRCRASTACNARIEQPDQLGAIACGARPKLRRYARYLL